MMKKTKSKTSQKRTKMFTLPPFWLVAITAWSALLFLFFEVFKHVGMYTSHCSGTGNGGNDIYVICTDYWFWPSLVLDLLFLGFFLHWVFVRHKKIVF